MYCSQFMTGYGPGIVYATDLGVVKVEIPDLSRRDKSCHSVLSEFESSDISSHAAHKLQSYFNGECIEFCDIPVVLDDMNLFRRNVLDIIRNLAYGEIRSYGQVADMCGSPRAARAVGGALASNPVPVIIPCHRVVASNGRLTGFSAPGGEITKRGLLKMEGVEFKGLLVDIHQLVMHRISNR
jgi:methylated-DNA-[protein]-cysteine S-methyltransferase